MADFNSDIQITIDAQTKAPSQAGFGTPCVSGFHNEWPEQSRRYQTAAAMALDGLTQAAYPAIYNTAAALFGQSPNSILELVMCRETNSSARVIEVTPILAGLASETSYDFYIDGNLATTAATDTSPIVSEVVTLMKAAIDAVIASVGITGVTTTDDTTHLTITSSAAGNNFVFHATRWDVFAIEDTTTTSGLDTDLDALIAYDNDWYELHLTGYSDAILNAGSAWVQTQGATNKKKLAALSQDNAIIDTPYNEGVTTDIASDLKLAGNGRTHIAYHYRAGNQSMTGGWSGNILPLEPGLSTYKFWELALCDTMDLTSTHISNLKSKNCNMYVSKGGYGVTQEGVACDGEFIDITRDLDFITARIQEGLGGLLAVSPKVPMDDDGATRVQSVVDGVMQLGVDNTIFRKDPAPTTSVPLIASVSSTNKALRHLPDVEFDAELAGAIHSIAVHGTVTV